MNDLKQSNYTLSGDFTLPSKGQIYTPSFDPHVKLRSMTVMEDMKRLSMDEPTNEVLADIIDACTVTELPISSYDMCMGDFEYLLHKVRVITHGQKYPMFVGCPNPKCNHVYKAELDLEEMTTKEFSTDEFFQSLSFQLPVTKHEIKLKMQTPRLQDLIDRKVKEYKTELSEKGNKADLDYTPLITLQYLIETVDGKAMDYIGIQQFIKKLPSADYNYIMKKTAKSNSMIGLNKEFTVICDKCKKPFKTLFRFTPEFFEPEID